jgi:transcriptional antiterminator NusG
MMTEEKAQEKIEEKESKLQEEALMPVEEQESPVAPEPAQGDSEAEESAAPEEKQEEEKDPRRKWYVIHCYSGYEGKVKKNLESRVKAMKMEDYVFNVVVPTEEAIEFKDGKKRVVEKRIFPGYILVEMILTEDSWYVVRNTPGVTGFVGMGNKPTPLSQEEVDKIMKRLESEEPVFQVGIKVGDKVRITEGPFAEFSGTVDEIYADKGKARVLVSFFNRETPVEVDLLQIERI